MIPLINATTAIGLFAARVGTAYDYGGMFSPTNTRVGTDCSGMVDTILRILTTGNGGPVAASGRFIRTLSTESWPYHYPDDLAVAVGTVGPYGTLCAGDAQPGPPPTVYPPRIPKDAAAVVYLMHGGGGENSHTMISVNDGTGKYVVMETGGGHNDTGGAGKYASRNGPATATNSPEWTDIWYLPGPVGGPAPAPTQFQHPPQADMITQIWDQLLGPSGHGWPQLGGLTPVDAIAQLQKQVAQLLKDKT